MTPDTEELKRLALATAESIAAANPQAILALVERLETLEAERKGTVRLTRGQGGVVKVILSAMNPHTEQLASFRQQALGWLSAAIEEAEREQTD